MADIGAVQSRLLTSGRRVRALVGDERGQLGADPLDPAGDDLGRVERALAVSFGSPICPVAPPTSSSGRCPAS